MVTMDAEKTSKLKIWAGTLNWHWKLWIKRVAILLTLVAAALGVWALYDWSVEELETSQAQAKYFHKESSKLSYALVQGPSDAIVFPDHGPLNQRRGYTDMDERIALLKNQGFEVRAQVVQNRPLYQFLKDGYHHPFWEKQQAGVSLVDTRGTAIYRSLHPKYQYNTLKEIPPLAVDTLLFLENRELLSNDNPEFNFVIEWDRLALATAQWAGSKVGIGEKGPGASTLATQIEKFNYSPGGQTAGAEEKFRQMYSAALRMYHDDTTSLSERDDVIVTYINQFPLAAVPGWGEVHGLADGLEAWFDLDIKQVNEILKSKDITAQKAKVYRHIVALFIALRAPNRFLVKNHEALETTIDEVLVTMAENGVIPEKLATLAGKERLSFRQEKYVPPQKESFQATKEVDALRVSTGNLLGLDSLYELDRFDLKAQTTLDAQLQGQLEELLMTSMYDETFLEENGFLTADLLGKGDPKQIDYSFLLYERQGGANKLRAMVDTLDEPFNLNESAKLDLGSTSKLRTLITYMELVADLHQKYGKMSRKELAAVKPKPRDVLTWWAIRELWKNRDMTLEQMLKAALDQKYSASAGGYFITGGGIHRFSNFNKDYNAYNLPVWRATQKSVNLVFIRMMRDIVWHYRWDKAPPEILQDRSHPMRPEYLMRWVKQDAAAYLRRFWPKYKKVSGEEVLETIVRDRKLSEYDIAAIYRYIKPQASLEEMKAFTLAHLRKSRQDDISASDTEAWQKLYDQHALEKFDLNDRGYISEIHPLEIWIAGQRYTRQEMTFKDAEKESAEILPEVYRWILKKGSMRAQNNRILTLLEQDAFDVIWRQWHSIGYPFDRLIPSLSTALGASADRPDAIAKMMGILAADGVMYPEHRVEEMVLAKDTPYETRLARTSTDTQGKQVIRPEVARALKEVLQGVVARGTAARARGLTQEQGGRFESLLGKTGTGDHTKKSVDRWGRTYATEAVSRTGVFAFVFDEKYFGIMTLYVDGLQAADYEFTSSSAVKLFTLMAPYLDAYSQRHKRSMIANLKPAPLKAPPAAPPEEDEERLVFDYLFRPLVEKFRVDPPAQEQSELRIGENEKEKKHAELAPSPPEK